MGFKGKKSKKKINHMDGKPVASGMSSLSPAAGNELPNIVFMSNKIVIFESFVSC